MDQFRNESRPDQTISNNTDFTVWTMNRAFSVSWPKIEIFFIKKLAHEENTNYNSTHNTLNKKIGQFIQKDTLKKWSRKYINFKL